MLQHRDCSSASCCCCYMGIISSGNPDSMLMQVYYEIGSYALLLRQRCRTLAAYQNTDNATCVRLPTPSKWDSLHGICSSKHSDSSQRNLYTIYPVFPLLHVDPKKLNISKKAQSKTFFFQFDIHMHGITPLGLQPTTNLPI